MNISTGVSAVQLSPAMDSRKVYIKSPYNKNALRSVQKVDRRRQPLLPEGPVGKSVRERMGSYRRMHNLYTIRGVHTASAARGRNLDIYA
ncbi:MAG: hypothetical protein PF637_07725 [Spirochaetes bacterium]|jgi:hypothetical protein|nr:hypothetical protein [Spirochaetota bacterium]